MGDFLITIGVIGPEESVSKITKVAEDFSNVICAPFIYSNVEEVQHLIESRHVYIDQWLFSGVMNYNYAIRNNLVNPKMANYPMLHGSSFFESLIGVQQKEEKLFKSISVDTIEKREMEKVLSFYEMDHLNYELSAFSYDKRPKDIVLFHKSLYENRKTEVAITALRSVYNSLVGYGIPVYRLTPSYLSIKLTIELLIEKAQANYYKNLQLAVVGCKAFEVNEYIENSIYDWKTNELHLKSSLLNITKQLNGSFIEPADGLYYVFTTRGEIDEGVEGSLFNCITFLKEQYQIDIGFAIGFGDTVFLAEQHVRYGLNQLVYDESPSVLIVKDEYNIEQRSMQNRENHLDIAKIKDFLNDNFKESNINVNDVVRIALYTHKYNKQHFTADDIAGWLNSTKRNASRILNDLEKTKVIEVFDKVKATPRGRPSNCYRFLNQNFLFQTEGGD